MTPISETKRARLPVAAKAERAAKQPATPTPPPFDGADDQQLLRQVLDYYRAGLKETPEALAYLSKRGLGNAEMIDHFQLGFANRTLGLSLPTNDKDAAVTQRERLQKLGVLRASGHEPFCGSVVIPIFGEGGEVLGLYGRKIRNDPHAGTACHLYLRGAHRGVWNIEALQTCDEVILCEALIDALTFWCAGYRNVTASYGVEGFTQDHLDAFERHGTKRVLIAYDHDEAGDRAAMKLAKKLTTSGIDCWRIEFPRGMDANEYALANQPAVKSLGVAIQSAVWMGEGKAPVVELGAMAPAVMGSTASEPGVPASNPPSLAADLRLPSAPSIPSPSAPPVSSPAAASPTARSPVSTLAVDVREGSDELVVQMGDRRWRVRGMGKNMSYDQLKVNLWCSRGELFHLDTLDLYAARPRMVFLKQASAELGLDEDILRRDLSRLLLKLEEQQDQQIQARLAPKTTAPVMSEAERAAALALLADPKLCERILADFEQCGAVGEETNKLVGYIAAVSRKLDRPLAVIIQSSSAAGKSSLMDAVLAFVPDEDKVKYSSMTGQSLFYMGETNLKHKILAIVEQAGADRASYALKLLQSEGELTMASTGKDPVSGRHVTHEYRMEGPVTVFSTTTASDVDEELLNRCLVLTVNEEREQTQAIHRRQRQGRTLEGLLARQERGQVLTLHQNAQRLLRPLCVVNPFAEKLTFVDDRTRTRRDHAKYLTLMEAIALLFQYQRQVHETERHGERIEYVEVTRDDVALANKLAHEVLGRSLDELPAQTRKLLVLIDSMVAEACKRLEVSRSDYRFSRREVRERTGWSYEQIRVHLERLVAMEYLLVHRGARGQSFVYELLYDGAGKDGSRFVMHLLDVKALTEAPTSAENASTTKSLGGDMAKFGVPYRAHTGPIPGGCRSEETGVTHEKNKGNVASSPSATKNTVLRGPIARHRVVG